MTAVLPPNAPGDLNTLDIHEWRLTVHNLPLERTGGLGTGNKSNQHISDDLRDLLESIVHCGEKKGKRIVIKAFVEVNIGGGRRRNEVEVIVSSRNYAEKLLATIDSTMDGRQDSYLRAIYLTGREDDYHSTDACIVPIPCRMTEAILYDLARQLGRIWSVFVRMLGGRRHGMVVFKEQVVARRAVKFDLYGMVDPQGLVSSGEISRSNLERFVDRCAKLGYTTNEWYQPSRANGSGYGEVHVRIGDLHEVEEVRKAMNEWSPEKWLNVSPFHDKAFKASIGNPAKLFFTAEHPPTGERTESNLRAQDELAGYRGAAGPAPLRGVIRHRQASQAGAAGLLAPGIVDPLHGRPHSALATERPDYKRQRVIIEQRAADEDEGEMAEPIDFDMESLLTSLDAQGDHNMGRRDRRRGGMDRRVEIVMRGPEGDVARRGEREEAAPRAEGGRGIGQEGINAANRVGGAGRQQQNQGDQANHPRRRPHPLPPIPHTPQQGHIPRLANQAPHPDDHARQARHAPQQQPGRVLGLNGDADVGGRMVVDDEGERRVAEGGERMGEIGNGVQPRNAGPMLPFGGAGAGGFGGFLMAGFGQAGIQIAAAGVPIAQGGQGVGDVRGPDRADDGAAEGEDGEEENDASTITDGSERSIVAADLPGIRDEELERREEWRGTRTEAIDGEMRRRETWDEERLRSREVEERMRRRWDGAGDHEIQEEELRRRNEWDAERVRSRGVEERRRNRWDDVRRNTRIEENERREAFDAWYEELVEELVGQAEDEDEEWEDEE